MHPAGSGAVSCRALWPLLSQHCHCHPLQPPTVAASCSPRPAGLPACLPPPGHLRSTPSQQCMAIMLWSTGVLGLALPLLIMRSLADSRRRAFDAMQRRRPLSEAPASDEDQPGSGGAPLWEADTMQPPSLGGFSFAITLYLSSCLAWMAACVAAGGAGAALWDA